MKLLLSFIAAEMSQGRPSSGSDVSGKRPRLSQVHIYSTHLNAYLNVSSKSIYILKHFAFESFYCFVYSLIIMGFLNT